MSVSPMSVRAIWRARWMAVGGRWTSASFFIDLEGDGHAKKKAPDTQGAEGSKASRA
jgi:hypothetical protein